MPVYKQTIKATLCAMLLVGGTLFSGITTVKAETVVIGGPFGEVPIGSVGVSGIQVNAPAGSSRTLTAMSFANDAAGQFSVNTTLPASGLYLAPGASTVIEVSFKPTVAGPASASLIISTLTTSGWTSVPGEIRLDLSGTGKALEPEEGAETDPQAAISAVEDLLVRFDSSVANGTLKARGKGKYAKKKLKAVRKTMKSVKRKLKRNKHYKACLQTWSTEMLLRSYVKGPAKAELVDGFEALSADLECEQKLKRKAKRKVRKLSKYLHRHMPKHIDLIR